MNAYDHVLSGLRVLGQHDMHVYVFVSFVDSLISLSSHVQRVVKQGQDVLCDAASQRDDCRCRVYHRGIIRGRVLAKQLTWGRVQPSLQRVYAVIVHSFAFMHDLFLAYPFFGIHSHSHADVYAA